jgi:hypothetical protein
VPSLAYPISITGIHFVAMPPRPQRLVRRRSFKERLHAFMNPMDFYLWLSEEIQTLNWDSKTFGTRFGLAENFIFLLARANSCGQQSVDDVFGDAPASSWVAVVVRDEVTPTRYFC